MPKKSREILAANLRRALDAYKEAGLSLTAWAELKHLQRKQVERVAMAKVGCSVDFLDDLAKALEVEPWQLMVPGLDLKAPPRIALTTDDILQIEQLQAVTAETVRRFTLRKANE